MRNKVQNPLLTVSLTDESDFAFVHSWQSDIAAMDDITAERASSFQAGELRAYFPYPGVETSRVWLLGMPAASRG